jgi:hypothetical protein
LFFQTANLKQAEMRTFVAKMVAGMAKSTQNGLTTIDAKSTQNGSAPIDQNGSATIDQSGSATIDKKE